MQNKKKLFVDFDLTLVNSIKSIVSIYNDDFQYYDNFVPVHWTDIKTYEFTECKCANREYINMCFNQKRFFDKLEYMDWAKEVLDKLKENYDITIVSMGYSPNLKAKEVWINEHLPFCKFIGVNFKEYSDKSHIDMNDSIFIDDSAHNLITSNAVYKICFGDEYKWNKDWDGVRCYNWHDVNYYLESMKGVVIQ